MNKFFLISKLLSIGIILFANNQLLYVPIVILTIELLLRVKNRNDGFNIDDILEEMDDILNQEPIADYSNEISKVNKVLGNYNIALTFLNIDSERNRIIFWYKLAKNINNKFTKVSDVKNILPELRLELNKEVQLIQGNGKIGLSILNDSFNSLNLYELLDTKAAKEIFNNKEYNLPFMLGEKLSDGEVVGGDLTRAPHILIAGETNSGKSNALQVLLTTLMLNKSHDELKLALADLKLVELSNFENSPYLYNDIIYNFDDFQPLLDKLINENGSRLKLLKANKCKNIQQYNKKNKNNKLPYIVFVIEELSIIMLNDDRETKNIIENKLAAFAAVCRATGIHIIITTQKPISDVLTGLIKANIPARLALRVSSNVDSRLIIENGDAVTLKGNGDAIFNNTRLQITLLDNDDQEEILGEKLYGGV
jgi:DNA segregation ATPase FtsK/SpoIIIE-like protein